MAEPGGSAIQLVSQYLASKGMPVTPDNVRRVLQMNSQNPGTIPGLVNGEAQPNPPTGASPQRSQGARPTPQAQPRLPVPPIPPQSGPPGSRPQVASDASQGGGAPPQAQAQAQPSQDGGGLITSLIQAILGGGAGMLGGLAGRSAVQGEPMGNAPMPPTGRMMDVPGDMIGGPGAQPQISGPGQLQLAAPQQQLPAPQQQQLPPPAMKLLPEDHGPVAGVNPIGPPQPGRLQQGPSSNVADRPLSPAPQGSAAASDVASHAPVSVVPREVGVDAADLGGHMDWGKILGEIAPLLKKLHP